MVESRTWIKALGLPDTKETEGHPVNLQILKSRKTQQKHVQRSSRENREEEKVEDYINVDVRLPGNQANKETCKRDGTDGSSRSISIFDLNRDPSR